MLLNSIELKNIRSYNHEKVEFPRGITLFEGDIGSGKSTVLMAIEFALFGLGSQKSDSLLSKKETEGYVILNFEVEGKSYEIKRKLKRKGDSISQESKSCHLVSDGEMEPLSASELKPRILQILKFNEPVSVNSESRIYRYAVFTPQEEMKQVLRDAKTRLETIRKAFGMEDYKIATENAKIMMFSLKEKIAVSKVGFSNMDKLKQSFEKLNKDQKNESQEILDITKEVNALEKKKIISHKVVIGARKKQKDKENFVFEKEAIEKDIKNNKLNLSSIIEDIAQKEIDIQESKNKIIQLEKIQKPTSKSLSHIEEEIKNFEDLNSEITDVTSKIDTISRELPIISIKLGSYSNSTIENCNDELEKITTFLAQLIKDHGEVKNLIKDKEKENAKLEERKQSLESKMKNTSKVGSKCPYCENVLTETHLKNLEKERKENLVTIIASYQQIQNEIDEKSIKEENLEKQISEKRDVISKIKIALPLLQQWYEKNDQVSKFKLKLKELEAKKVIPEEKSFSTGNKSKDPLLYLKALRDALIQFDNAEKQVKQEEERKERTEVNLNKITEKKNLIEKKISELENKLIDFSKKLVSFGDVDNILQHAENTEESIRENLEKLKRQLSVKNEKMRNLKEEIQRINGEILDAQKAQQKYEVFNNCHDWLKDFFVPTLEQVEKQVLYSIQYNFNTIYQNWFSVLIDDPTKQSRIDEDFTPLIEQDGYEQNIEYLSGGEKTSIALSYRLTLNSMIRQETESLKSNLLILDEPTDGFSKSQLTKVRTVLQQLQSQQIILVSHEKELETYVDHIFYISKDGGNSHVSRRNS